MIRTSFYLRDNNSVNQTPIVMYLRWAGNNIKYPTDQLCLPKDWQGDDKKKGYQRVKGATGYHINRRLDYLATTSKNVYQQLLNNNGYVPTKGELLSELDIALKKRTRNNNFFAFAKQFVEESKTRANSKTGKTISKVVIVKYNRTIKYLQEFDSGLDFESFDLTFYNKFIAFLHKKNLATNTIGKHISDIKAILNSSVERGINKNMAYKSNKFVAITEESDSIYLTRSELKEIENLDLSENTFYGQSRDLFLIGCYTGMRYSDYSTLIPENIKDGFIHKEALKTTQPVIIPIHPVVQKILDKYNGHLPRSSPIHRVNAHLKEICQRVPSMKSTSEIVSITRGGKRLTSTRVRYNLVATHTARRTFATNAYLDGIPVQVIMAITGHKTEKSFFKYIKIGQKEKAQMLKDFWEKEAKK